MTKQKKQMDNMKFYLKEKGDDYERDDLQAEIVFQTDKIKRKLQLASLENLIRETTHHEKGQKVSDRVTGVNERFGRASLQASRMFESGRG